MPWQSSGVDMHTAKLPSATQLYVPENKNQKVRRSTVCPIHEKATSDYLGANQRTGQLVWVFRCSYSDHVFAALPDKNTPRPGEELAWIRQQEALKVSKEMSKRQ